MERSRTSLAAIATLVLIGGAMPAATDAQESHEVPVARLNEMSRARRPEMEAAARAFVFNIAQNRVGPADGPLPVPMLDSLKDANLDAYWMEVSHLAIQFDMFQRVASRGDTARARSLKSLFGAELELRALQRAWRGASAAERRSLRTRLEAQVGRHLDAELELQELELRDIRRRLAMVEADRERQRGTRQRQIAWQVDAIIHDAERPE